ncbi:MAG: tRNA (adenosine(37)-N6)-threonylcarbamoyltransferase complex ATPase subunit type 1 TsaE [Bacteroidota bacterium]
MEEIVLTYSLDTIDDAVQQFWSAAAGIRLIAFSGDMGAGKTTFIHKLCDHLGVDDAVSSPTFALVNEYHFTGNDGNDNIIYHCDWYRLGGADEAINAGMEDCMLQAKSGGAWCFIEWPEKATALLEKPYLWASIETISITERKMTLQIINRQA